MSIRQSAGVFGCALLLCVQAAGAAQTATQVTIKNEKGRSEAILIGERMARMGTGEKGQYMLIELDGDRIHMVDEQRREIHELKSGGKTDPAPAGDARLDKQGSGPEIAGYDTKHYHLLAGDTRCGDIFVSREAFEVSGIEPVYRATRAMARKMRAMTAGFGAMGGDDPCERADDLMLDNMEKYGMLMRSLDKNGKLETEVVAIKEDVTVAPGTFDLPEDYQRTDVNREMSKAQEMMRQMPNMQEIQELGRMSPEAREEAMRRMQERMRAIQQ